MRLGRFVGFICLGTLAGCHSGQRQVEMIAMRGSVATLRERFNADLEKVRVVALLSPV